MIDRLVCADGGNPDRPRPTASIRTKPRRSSLAAGIIQNISPAGCSPSVVHGDSVGAETLRRSLSDWLTDMELISAGTMPRRTAIIGYEKPYATSHQELDADEAFQQDVRSAATTLARAIALQSGRRHSTGRWRVATGPPQ